MARLPNIVFVYADDLGRGMLSCYGQEHFATPNIDRLACDGVRFTRAYGCAFCAPARASLLSGIHDCHAGRWSYSRGGIWTDYTYGRRSAEEVAESLNNTFLQDHPNEVFLPQLLKDAGYVTGQIGKIEWGFSTTAERVRRHGWDYHYGYYDHQLCHGFYPPFLHDNGTLTPIAGNTCPDAGKAPECESPENREKRHSRKQKATYSQDLFDRQIVAFLERHQNQPFFLFHPSQLPHGPIEVPSIHPAIRDASELTEYEKEYASMILRLDDTVGLISDTLKRLGLLENTLFLFSSDNGHEVYYREEGRCSGSKKALDGTVYDNVATRHTSEAGGDIFNGNDGMAGNKFTSWEGGPRIPYLASWPGHIEPGSVSDHFFANYDLMPTLAEIGDVRMPPYKDGLSFLPCLEGRLDQQALHDEIVYANGLGPALVTQEGMKIRYLNTVERFQLYDLANDYAETANLAADRPDQLRQLAKRLVRACDGNLYNGTPQAHLALLPENYLATTDRR